MTGALSDREKTDQFMDKMDLEKERGVTFKAQTARLRYKARDGRVYILNLIDTRGPRRFQLRGQQVSSRPVRERFSS